MPDNEVAVPAKELPCEFSNAGRLQGITVKMTSLLGGRSLVGQHRFPFLDKWQLLKLWSPFCSFSFIGGSAPSALMWFSFTASLVTSLLQIAIIFLNSSLCCCENQTKGKNLKVSMKKISIICGGCHNLADRNNYSCQCNHTKPPWNVDNSLPICAELFHTCIWKKG